MKLKKKEEQSLNILVFLRRGNKIPTEGDTETKCGAASEGKNMWRLPHLGINSIYSLQNPDTIVDAHKSLLTGTAYSCYMGGMTNTEGATISQPLN